MNKKQKNRFIIIVVSVLVVLTAVRIHYVNVNARLPETVQVKQGDKGYYRGLEYSIERAELWDYEDFFQEYSGLEEYRATNPIYDRKILLVTYRVSVAEDENALDIAMPIQYSHCMNNVDPFMFSDMNPSLVDGTFQSGDSILIPYELYEENLTKTGWQDICNMKMQYKVILGCYPEKNELLITDINKMTYVE